jgi:hypothetical protein
MWIILLLLPVVLILSRWIFSPSRSASSDFSLPLASALPSFFRAWRSISSRVMRRPAHQLLGQ